MLSCIGAMFAPDHAATARELLRVCRPGGTVAMANWTPDGEVGRFFRILARYGPAAGRRAAADGVGRPGVRRAPCSRGRGADRATAGAARFTGPPAEVTAYYRRHFPPVIATFAGLDPDRAAALDASSSSLRRRGHRAGGRAVVLRAGVPAGPRPVGG